MSRILVTGGAGFVGTELVYRLHARGDDVVVVDSFDRQVHDGIGFELPARLYRESVGSSHCREIVRDCDKIVHLAAVVGVGQSMYQIARYVKENTYATACFLENLVEVGNCQKLVVASSMSIYGEGASECPSCEWITYGSRSEEALSVGVWRVPCPACGEWTVPAPTPEDAPLRPSSVYAITKRDHEELCLTVGGVYGIPTIALRFFNIYGPGQALSNPYTGVAAIFASRILNGKPCRIYEDGKQARDFIHVSDVVDAIVAALDADPHGPAVGQTINVGTGVPIPVSAVANQIEIGRAHV